MPIKTERGTLWDFSKFILSEKIKKLKGDPLVEKNFRKSLRAENILRKYPLAPLSLLNDVKILLRKVSKNFKIVRILRKVDHSE